jgi:hypothetical protein
MGTVKENMKTTSPKAAGLMDRLLSRKKTHPTAAVQSDDVLADSFADHIACADEKLEKLLESKHKDRANEKGQEKENDRKIKLLSKMQNYLEDIAELVKEYSES